MKIGFVSVYRDGTGYSYSAQEIARALDAVGIDLVARTYKINHEQGFVHPRILELEKKPADEIDTIIQYMLPHQMVYSGNVKNIAMFMWETSRFDNSAWPQYLNMFDEIWVPNADMIDACRLSGVTKTIHHVGHPIDIDKYKQSYAPFPIAEVQDKFVFYFVGEFNRRKNIAALLKAFHIEFNRNENVSLMLKTSIPGLPPETAQQEISKMCNEVKNGLKIYKQLEHYIPEIIISNTVTPIDMLRIHATGHCLVMPSYGEGLGMPVYDALGLGKPVIVNKVGGLKELVDDKCGWLVDNHTTPCFGMNNTFQDLYTAEETWQDIDIGHLRQCMRAAFEDKVGYMKKRLAAFQRVTEFSYNKIGNRMKELLCQVQ